MKKIKISLDIWFKHFGKNPFKIIIWLFLRPYLYINVAKDTEEDIITTVEKLNFKDKFAISLIITLVYMLLLLPSFLFIFFGACMPVRIELLRLIVLGTAVGGGFGVIWGTAFSIAGGVAWGTTFGVAGGLSFGMVCMDLYLLNFDLLKILIDAILGSPFSILIWGIAFSVAIGIAWGISFEVISGILIGTIWSKVSGVWGVLGILRVLDWIVWIVFLPIALFLRWKQPLSKYNGYLVLPLLGDHWLLYKRLKKGIKESYKDFMEISFNPFQRWIVQRAIKKYYSEMVPKDELLKEFKNIRKDCKPGNFGDKQIYFSLDFENGISLPELILGELGLMPSRDSKWIWNITKPLRNKSDEIVVDVAEAYYHMIFSGDEPGYYYSVFERAHKKGIKYADELVWTYKILAEALKCESIYDILNLLEKLKENIPLCKDDFDCMISPEFLQQEVMEAFQRLLEIGENVKLIKNATSAYQRREASTLALTKLEELNWFVKANLFPPEYRYFLEILEKWRQLIAKEAKEMVKKENVVPVQIPYVIGAPAFGEIFKGRKDIFLKIEELWNKKQSSLVPILLYGHRRMGKTSIAKNLTERYIGSSYVSLYVSAQGYGASESEILMHFANAFKNYVGNNFWGNFKNDPRNTFVDIIRRAKENINNKIVILVIDEFEEIENSIKEKRIPEDFVKFLRAVSQENAEWLGLLLVGSHRLEEMTREYWSPFWGSIHPIKVGFMDYDSAWELITQPTKDFKLNYEKDVVNRIIILTGGQPFLINKICFSMLSELNRQINAKKYTEYPILDSKYLKVALKEVVPDRTNYYFEAVWRQIGEEERKVLFKIGELKVKKLQIHKVGEMLDLALYSDIKQPCLKISELQQELNWEKNKFISTLCELAKHDIVKPFGSECKPLGCRQVDIYNCEEYPNDACLCICVPLIIPWLLIRR